MNELDKAKLISAGVLALIVLVVVLVVVFTSDGFKAMAPFEGFRAAAPFEGFKSRLSWPREGACGSCKL